LTSTASRERSPGGPGPKRIDADGTVITDRVLVLRDEESGEIVLQMHGARLVWNFSDGRLSSLQIFDSQGPIASQRIVDAEGAAVSVTGSFIDALP